MTTIISRPKSDSFQAFSLTMKSVVGSGIIALPFAVSQAGWLAGTFGMVLIAILSRLTMRQMIQCVHVIREQRADVKRRQGQWVSHDDSGATDAAGGDEEDAIGYRQIGGAAFGRSGELIVDIALISCQIGSNCAFIAFIASNLHSVLSSPALFPSLSLSTVVLCLFPVLALLAIPRTTTYLAPTSHLGNLALLVGLSTVVWCGWERRSLDQAAGLPTGLSPLPAFNSVSGLCTFFGVAAFAFSAHAEVVAVESDVQEGSKYLGILDICMSFTALLYVSFALFAYGSFGGDTSSNIFLNLGEHTFVTIVKLCMSIVVCFNYPITLFPAMQALDDILMGPAHNSVAAEPESVGLMSSSTTASSSSEPPLLPRSTSTASSSSALTSRQQWARWMKGTCLRIGTVALTCLVATTVQNFGLLTALVGSTSGGLLSFILPPLFYLRLVSADSIAQADSLPIASAAAAAVSSVSSSPSPSMAASGRGRSSALSGSAQAVIAIQVALGLALFVSGLAVGIRDASAPSA